ncbi:MAG: hypothetical protein GY939_09340 [Actinomycetia bacterium]|nr:hypothetical protein [Actinomycetes bacterium]
MRWSWIGVLMVLMVVAGACGGSDDPSAEPDEPSEEASTTAASSDATSTPEPETTDAATETVDVDACVLVDAADAERILGAPATVDTTPAGGFGETSACSWVTESDALLVVTVFEGRQFYGGGESPGAEPLDFGDEGYIVVEETFGGVDLQVVEDDWLVTLSAAPFGIVDVPALPATMTAAAQMALDRLPD